MDLADLKKTKPELVEALRKELLADPEIAAAATAKATLVEREAELAKLQTESVELKKQNERLAQEARHSRRGLDPRAGGRAQRLRQPRGDEGPAGPGHHGLR